MAATALRLENDGQMVRVGDGHGLGNTPSDNHWWQHFRSVDGCLTPDGHWWELKVRIDKAYPSGHVWFALTRDGGDGPWIAEATSEQQTADSLVEQGFTLDRLDGYWRYSKDIDLSQVVADGDNAAITLDTQVASLARFATDTFSAYRASAARFRSERI